MTSGSCKNHPHCFCSICGEYNRMPLTEFEQKVCYAYFRIKLGHHDKPSMGYSCYLQDMNFEKMNKWNQTINGNWYTNGLEGA